MAGTYQEIPKQDHDGHLSNRRDENRRPFSDLVGEVLQSQHYTAKFRAHEGTASQYRARKWKTNLLARKVHTDRALPQQRSIKLILIPGHTGNNHITQRRNILQRPALQINNLMPLLLQPLATRKLLHPRDIHTIHARAIIRQQGRQRPPHDLRPIHHADRMPKQAIPIRQDRIVDIQVLEDLDIGQRRARQDTLLTIGAAVQEPDVLVHVEDVAVRQALDVLVHVHDLLQVLVLPVVEDRVVDDYPVHGGVGVRG